MKLILKACEPLLFKLVHVHFGKDDVLGKGLKVVAMYIDLKKHSQAGTYLCFNKFY